MHETGDAPPLTSGCVVDYLPFRTIPLGSKNRGVKRWGGPGGRFGEGPGKVIRVRGEGLRRVDETKTAAGKHTIPLPAFAIRALQGFDDTGPLHAPGAGAHRGRRAPGPHHKRPIKVKFWQSGPAIRSDVGRAGLEPAANRYQSRPASSCRRILQSFSCPGSDSAARSPIGPAGA